MCQIISKTTYLREALPQDRRKYRTDQVSLGDSSIQTTERYLGPEQEIEIAVNDNLGFELGVLEVRSAARRSVDGKVSVSLCNLFVIPAVLCVC
jgi:hypothetical protein